MVLKGHTQIELSNWFAWASNNWKRVETLDNATIQIKVLGIANPESVGRNKTKQDISASDATTNVGLTTWE